MGSQSYGTSQIFWNFDSRFARSSGGGRGTTSNLLYRSPVMMGVQLTIWSGGSAGCRGSPALPWLCMWERVRDLPVTATLFFFFKAFTFQLANIQCIISFRHTTQWCNTYIQHLRTPLTYNTYAQHTTCSSQVHSLSNTSFKSDFYV